MSTDDERRVSLVATLCFLPSEQHARCLAFSPSHFFTTPAHYLSLCFCSAVPRLEVVGREGHVLRPAGRQRGRVKRE